MGKLLQSVFHILQVLLQRADEALLRSGFHTAEIGLTDKECFGWQMGKLRVEAEVGLPTAVGGFIFFSSQVITTPIDSLMLQTVNIPS